MEKSRLLKFYGAISAALFMLSIFVILKNGLLKGKISFCNNTFSERGLKNGQG